MFGLLLDPEEKQLQPFRGAPVCLLMKDGSRKIGQLTGCASGRLTLNGSMDGDGDAGIARNSEARRAKRSRPRKAKDALPAGQPPAPDDMDNMTLERPFGFEPPFGALPHETVPLKTVESILIL